MNGLGEQVTVVEAAATDTAGRRSFRALSELSAGAHLAEDQPSATDGLAGETVDVDAVDIGAFAASLSRAPNLVKVDAKGEDLTILRRLLGVLAPSPRRVFVIEILAGDPDGPELPGLFDLLAEHELQIFAFQGRARPEAVDEQYVREIGWEDVLLARPERFAR